MSAVTGTLTEATSPKFSARATTAQRMMVMAIAMKPKSKIETASKAVLAPMAVPQSREALRSAPAAVWRTTIAAPRRAWLAHRLLAYLGLCEKRAPRNCRCPRSRGANIQGLGRAGRGGRPRH